jgi:hypothetical protein
LEWIETVAIRTQICADRLVLDVHAARRRTLMHENRFPAVLGSWFSVLFSRLYDTIGTENERSQKVSDFDWFSLCSRLNFVASVMD